jgi:phosphocarrier protein HPr
MEAPPPGESEDPLSCEVAIVNKRGLHARASAKFVQCAERFQAQINVERDGQIVAGTSIMGLMMLAAAPGTQIKITASGKDAAEALAALRALIEGRFGEEG